MSIVFAICVVMLVYVYAGYPVLCALIAILRSRDVRSAEGTPSVTIIIAAFNEAACIEHTLRNKLSLDYPSDRVEIIVVSDASNDGTDEIVRRVAEETSQAARLLRQEPRAGKTAALNLAAEKAVG